MKKQALSLAVMIAGTYPVASNALSLGDIESNSNLNQPLRARIELLSANPRETQQLRVRIAPASVFSRVGIDRPAFLDHLRFSSAVQNGKPVILVSSDAPISEPFVNFLLEVSWPQGQLLKEYTVMLDPPVLMQPGNTMLASNEAAVRAEPRPSGIVNRPAQQQPQAVRRVAQAPRVQQTRRVQQAALPAKQVVQQPVRPHAAGSRTYRVQSGDTLHKIASRMHAPGVNIDQMMWALYRSNPQAFIENNINGLKAGAVLRAPAAGVAETVSRAEARRQVRQQYAAWKKFRATLARKTVPQSSARTASNKTKSNKSKAAATSTARNDKARLEVLGSKDKLASNKTRSSGGNSARLAELEKDLALARESLATRQRETQELRSRVAELESLLSKKDRLIALRDDQLAALQRNLAATPQANDIQNHMGNVDATNNAIIRAEPDKGKAATATGANNTGSGANRASTSQQTQTPVTSPAQSTAPARPRPPVSQPVTPPSRPPVQTEETAPKQSVAQPVKPTTSEASGSDLMSLLSSPLLWKIGLGALASLLILGLLLRFMGRRKARNNNDFEENFDTADFDLDAQPVAVHKAQNNFDSAYGDLEDQLNKAEKLSGQSFDDSAHIQADQKKAAVSSSPVKTPLPDTEGDEVLEEANVYIAYGLHQQAESELKKALEKHPERLEYRHKLLENYFAANNREAFDQQAAAFLSSDAGRQSPFWKDIAAWGSKISPDNPLYRTDGSTAANASSKLGAGVAAVGAAVAGAAGVAAVKASDFADSVKDTAKDTAGLDDSLDDDDFALGSTASTQFDDDLLSDSSLDDSFSSDASFADEKDEFDFELDEIERQLARHDDDLDSFADHELNTDDLDSADTVGDDLDFNLDDLVTDSGSSAKDDTFSTDFDDDNTVDLSGAVADDLQLDDALDFNFDDDSLADNTVESLDFTDTDTGSDSESNSAELDELEQDDLLDFDLDDPTELEAEASQATSPAAANDDNEKVTNLNLHLDENTGIKKILPQDTFYAQESKAAANPTKPPEDEESWLGDIDDALSFLDMPDDELDLHEAHISTKLDLARAYLDMGDIEGARSTLEEVMVEGNDNQRREAETLLHQTG